MWKNKRHKINKKNLIWEDIEKGGLKLISLSEMDMCLKITWIFEIIVSEPEWPDFATTYRIDRLVTTDMATINYCIITLKIPSGKVSYLHMTNGITYLKQRSISTLKIN